ncbi:MAG: asparagine synthase (glutamine-hydrolyzing), partial [Verrucomicrobiota bacterium]
MCGIFAWFGRKSSAPVPKEQVLEWTRLMQHRGPDAEGEFTARNVALGHRRLSIIDLAAGQQPMQSPDGSITLVFNGEIYNYQEIREELLAKGHMFRTHSDTEVIIEAYREWGTTSVQRFNGMFAYALWDARQRRLWVARDRMGVKPLYYYSDKDRFLCASEIKPLLAAGNLPRTMNLRVLDAYFSLGYVPGRETMFEGIRKLPPGHWLEVTEGGVKEVKYWDFAHLSPQGFTYDEACKRTDELLADAVKKCLVSDVPLGVCLSGGVDSSAVLAFMHASGASPLASFTASYGKLVPESEESYAQIAAEKFKTLHHLFLLNAQDFFASIQTMVSHAEEPLVEPAAIPLYHLSKLARSHVKVLLSGEGSDELFGGYGIYQLMLRMERLRSALPDVMWSAFKTAAHDHGSLKFQKYADWMAL